MLTRDAVSSIPLQCRYINHCGARSLSPSLLLDFTKQLRIMSSVAQAMQEYKWTLPARKALKPLTPDHTLKSTAPNSLEPP
jgi:hypothetical protein